MTWGRILHLSVRVSHTKRPPPQPAILCRPQLGRTHQRAQQPAQQRGTTDTVRNLDSHTNLERSLLPCLKLHLLPLRLLLCSALALSLSQWEFEL